MIGALAVIVSLVGAFLTRGVSGAQGFGAALVGGLLGAVVGGYPAAQLVKARRVPPIHDITTDTANPPTFVALAPADLFSHAAKLAADDGWQVVDAVPQDGRIEATATTRMFGFKDDIVLRVRAADKGSELDMRSMSRIGQSDVGANAARIRGFMEQLRAAGA